jgi:hypothetical protein
MHMRKNVRWLPQLAAHDTLLHLFSTYSCDSVNVSVKLVACTRYFFIVQFTRCIEPQTCSEFAFIKGMEALLCYLAATLHVNMR